MCICINKFDLFGFPTKTTCCCSFAGTTVVNLEDQRSRGSDMASWREGKGRKGASDLTVDENDVPFLFHNSPCLAF